MAFDRIPALGRSVWHIVFAGSGFARLPARHAAGLTGGGAPFRLGASKATYCANEATVPAASVVTFYQATSQIHP